MDANLFILEWKQIPTLASFTHTSIQPFLYYLPFEWIVCGKLNPFRQSFWHQQHPQLRKRREMLFLWFLWSVLSDFRGLLSINNDIEKDCAALLLLLFADRETGRGGGWGISLTCHCWIEFSVHCNSLLSKLLETKLITLFVFRVCLCELSVSPIEMELANPSVLM